MRLDLRVLAFLAAVLVAGCAREIQTQSRTQPDDLGHNTVVAVTNNSLPLRVGTTVSWYSEVYYISDQDIQKDPELSNIVHDLLEKSVTELGLNFVENKAEAQYQLIAVLALGEIGSSETVQDVFRLYPELALDSSKYTRGTLMAAIIDPATKKAAWRGAIQVVADETQPIEVRRKRIDQGIKRLTESLDEAVAN